MAACNVVVQASRSEGCSRSICESLSMGKPVIASRAGGNPELVDDGSTGYLFDIGDPGGLAEKATQLLADPAELKRIRNEAREKAVRDIGLERHCRETVAVYDELLARGNS